MKCETFRILYSKHGKLPLERSVWDTPEHEKWTEHFHDCLLCSDWVLEQYIIERGDKPANYPCVHIGDYVSKVIKEKIDPWDDPDILITKYSEGYGIPIRDGGTSFIAIKFCPWCAVKC